MDTIKFLTKTEIEPIWINDNFSDQAVKVWIDRVEKHIEHGPQFPVILYINSYGGAVDSLLAFLDYLDSIPNKIITVCMGKAMSAGAVLLSHGDERYCGPNSRVMLHQVSGGTIDKLNNMKVDLKEADRLNKTLMRLLAKNTKKSEKEIKALYDQNVDKYFTAKQAVDFSLVDRVGVPRLTKTVTYCVDV